MAAYIQSPPDTCLSSLIQKTLCSLHILPNLLGHQYLAYAVEQVVLDPTQIRGLTKRLYKKIARVYATDHRAVEHAIRTAIKSCWYGGGKEKLAEMACAHLDQRPWASEFIAIVAQYIRKTYQR